jgi:hypothetical protein
MENIIEYINISNFQEMLKSMFDEVLVYSPLTYTECGAKSWTLSSSSDYSNIWKSWLDLQRKVSQNLCPLATGFNFNPTNNHTVPPHIDIDEPLYYNLLIPVTGVAKINIFETVLDHLEYRHGMTHWKMIQDQFSKNKIGELIVDRPVLLNTNWLHDVEPIESPRCVWCTRWIRVPETYSFRSFKNYTESVLNI